MKIVLKITNIDDLPNLNVGAALFIEKVNRQTGEIFLDDEIFWDLKQRYVEIINCPVCEISTCLKHKEVLDYLREN